MAEVVEYRKVNASRCWRDAFGKLLLGRRPSAREKQMFSNLLAMSKIGAGLGNAKMKRTARTCGLGRRKAMQPVLDSLREWFLRIRGSIRGRFPKRALALQASHYRDQYVSFCLANGKKPDVCEIRSRWLDDFCAVNHVPYLGLQCVALVRICLSCDSIS